MSLTIATFNQCGGVGKTSLTMNLGYALAKTGKQILLVDLDPQASLTTFYDIDPTELNVTLYDALFDSANLPIHTTNYQTDLVPTNITLSAAEMELVAAMNREQRLKLALADVVNKYDYILIDCPPSLGLLTILGLAAATHLLVPIETEFKSYFGTGLLLDTVARVRKHLNPNLKFMGFVPMKYDKRRSQHTRTYEQMQKELTALAPVFPPVPDSTAFPDAAEERLPLAVYKPKHPAVKVINQIASEINKSYE